MAKGKDQQFESLRVVGNLLGSKVLQDVRFYTLPGQAPADYGIEKGLKLNDEMSRYWRIAQSRWQEYQQQRQRTDISQHKLAQQDWLLPLLEKVLGYSVEPSQRIVLGEREFPITHTAHQAAVPMVLCGADKDLDKGDAIFGQEGRKRSPMGLAQEYLNAQSACLWAIVSNGTHLRLLRDNPAMTRPAYIEVDFARLFDEDNYADFATLWLLLHSSRTAPQAGAADNCWLEQWRNKSQGEGERIVEGLRYGVADALRQLGTGFVAHPANQALRNKLSNGELTKEAYFQQVLRLVYRLLFLLTAEDRDIALLPGDECKAARELYEKGYSVANLRERARLKRHHDLHGDAWQQLLITFQGFAKGQPLLAQPALGGLFDAEQCADLQDCLLQNCYLYSALFKLGYFEHKGTRSRINYRDMNTEEFGSVYEALLELHPQLHTEGQWRFSFQGDAEGEQAASGNARKLSGSYYTPDSLVQELIKSALVPVIESRLEGKRSQQERREALLSITVCDPACGSGHFLLGAARRLAAELAQIDADKDQPSNDHYRHALRVVIRQCIYGVDINPMSVELCKVALWMESIEPGRPLGFLDHHIRTGNSLIGVTPELIASGLPDGAYNYTEGDDKKVCSQLKKINKAGRDGFSQENLWSVNEGEYAKDLENIANNADKINDFFEEAIDDVKVKIEMYHSLIESKEYSHAKLVADAWCSVFFLDKKIELIPYFVDSYSIKSIANKDQLLKKDQEIYILELAKNYGFFHWHIEFPDVFGFGGAGGFDLIIGNPPWESLSPNRVEFLGFWESGLRSMSPAMQGLEIERLLANDDIRLAWENHCKKLFKIVNFIKNSGVYEFFSPGNLGKGDFNVYRMFVEIAIKRVRAKGFASMIVPGGLYGGANSSAIRKYFIDKCELRYFYGLINTSRKWFPEVDIDRFCAFSVRRGGETNSIIAKFGLDDPGDLSGDPVYIDANDIRLLTPDTYAIPEVRNSMELKISKKMYAAVPVFGDETKGFPIRQYVDELHMTNNKNLFTTDLTGYPVYEGRMVDHYDHRSKTYQSGHGNGAIWIERQFGDPEKLIVPQWRVLPDSIPTKLLGRCHKFRIGFNHVSNPRNARTLIAALIPPYAICGNAVTTISFDDGYEWAYLLWLGVANSLTMDALLRRKLSSPNITWSVMDSLPFPRPIFSDNVVQKICPKVLRLVCTSPEFSSFWNIMAKIGLVNEIPANSVPESAAMDPIIRAELCAEIEVYVASCIYGLTIDELRYQMSMFEALIRREQREYGEYRTQRLVLEAWDKLERGELQ